MTLVHNTPLSRAAAVGLLLGLIAAIYLMLVVPLQTYYADSRHDLEQLNRQLSAYQRIASSRNTIEKAFTSIRPEDEQSGYYLKGATKALAAAELQAYARSIIESSKGELVSTQPIGKHERLPDRMVKVSVRMSGNIDSLMQVLYRFSSGVPVLLTDEVLIRRDKSTLTRSDDIQFDDSLDVQFVLTGFVKESVSR